MAERLYLRPTGFVDAPPQHDGAALRLAGGPCYFSAIELIAVADGRRTRQDLVPVGQLDRQLDAAGHDILARLTAPRAPIPIAGRMLMLDRPQVMAILNITPDSFSDGGRHNGDPAGAADAGLRMVAAGAALLDIGGESTRPGAATVAAPDEIARVLPVIRSLAAAGAPISIDTRKAAVMEAALDAGAGIVNDVSALAFDAGALPLVAARGCPIVLMHHRARPSMPSDVLIEVYDWLEERIDAAVAAGVERARIVIDPGLGAGSFGKSVADNLALINGLSLFHGLGCPILLGASRKSFIGRLNGEAPVARRLGGSLATALAGANQGVQLFRVHDADETVQALRVWQGLRENALAPRAGPDQA